MGEAPCIVKRNEAGKQVVDRDRTRPELVFMNDRIATLGVVLAGGRSQRMGGGNKTLRVFAGCTILSRVVARLAPQCAGLVINANDDPERFAALGLPVVADNVKGHAGPLAGVLAALDWAAAQRPAIDYVVSAAGDCPFLPGDLVARLHEARIEKRGELAVAASGERRHPVIGLWSVALRASLRHALSVEGCRKVDDWIARHRFAIVSWPTTPFDPFFNINTPADLAEAERIANFADD
jgi:molybdenum cofactor guanylyltransferase